MRQVNVIITQSEKGGCGKTTIADAISAGLRAAGRTVLNVDADDGNRGLVRRTGKSSAQVLAWQTPAQEVDDWLEQNLGDHEVLLIDCGANLLASRAPLTCFLDRLVNRVLEHGGVIHPLAIASTNCPGTDRLTRNMRDAFEDYGNVRLILNNQDGSNAFELSPIVLGIKSATFPHIPGGIMAARLLSARPLIEVLQNPPEGYTFAMSWIARIVSGFLKQPIIAEIVGSNASDLISGLATTSCGPLWFNVKTLQLASDEALLANTNVHAAQQNLRHLSITYDGDSERLAQAALAWATAEKAFYNLV